REHRLRSYVIRRLLLMIPTFIGVTFLVFLLTQFVPGGPIDQLLAQSLIGSNSESGAGSARQSAQLISPEQLASLQSYYGFDKPIIERYKIYMLNLMRLDFGDSFQFSTDAEKIIISRMPISIYYGLITTIL